MAPWMNLAHRNSVGSGEVPWKGAEHLKGKTSFCFHPQCSLREQKHCLDHKRKSQCVANVHSSESVKTGGKEVVLVSG